MYVITCDMAATNLVMLPKSIELRSYSYNE